MNTIKLSLLAATALLSATAATSASADVITFDTQPEVYFVSPVIDSGYVFTSTADGFGTNNNSLWPSNGTTHLMSWTNGGTTSGFTLTNQSGALFGIGTFQFGGGYVSGSSPVNSLTVTGTGGASNFTRTFLSGVDFVNSQMSTLDLGGLTATQFTFTAEGQNNRANFDNINVDTNVSAVPEPSTWAMMLVGFGAVGFSMRRRKSEQRSVRFA